MPDALGLTLTLLFAPWHGVDGSVFGFWPNELGLDSPPPANSLHCLALDALDRLIGQAEAATSEWLTRCGHEWPVYESLNGSAEPNVILIPA